MPLSISAAAKHAIALCLIATDHSLNFTYVLSNFR